MHWGEAIDGKTKSYLHSGTHIKPLLMQIVWVSIFSDPKKKWEHSPNQFKIGIHQKIHSPYIFGNPSQFFSCLEWQMWVPSYHFSKVGTEIVTSTKIGSVAANSLNFMCFSIGWERTDGESENLLKKCLMCMCQNSINKWLTLTIFLFLRSGAASACGQQLWQQKICTVWWGMTDHGFMQLVAI